MKIACVLGQGFEDSEFRVPYDRLKEEGYQVDIIGMKAGEELNGKKGKEKVKAEKGIDQVAIVEPVQRYRAGPHVLLGQARDELAYALAIPDVDLVRMAFHEEVVNCRFGGGQPSHPGPLLLNSLRQRRRLGLERHGRFLARTGENAQTGF